MGNKKEGNSKPFAVEGKKIATLNAEAATLTDELNVKTDQVANRHAEINAELAEIRSDIESAARSLGALSNDAPKAKRGRPAGSKASAKAPKAKSARNPNGSRVLAILRALLETSKSNTMKQNDIVASIIKNAPFSMVSASSGETVQADYGSQNPKPLYCSVFSAIKAMGEAGLVDWKGVPNKSGEGETSEVFILAAGKKFATDSLR